MTADSTTQPFPSTVGPGGMLSGLMEMGMMSNGSKCNNDHPAHVTAHASSWPKSSRRVIWKALTLALPLHVSPPTLQHSSPPAAQIANPMSLDDFIIKNSFQGIHEKIEAIGWEPGQAVFNLDDKPWAR